jgi:hypothetical protein
VEEVAVYQNGQTATSSTSYEKRGTKWERWLAFIEVRVSHLFSHGCLSIKMYSHLFLHFVPPLFLLRTSSLIVSPGGG